MKRAGIISSSTGCQLSCTDEFSIQIRLKDRTHNDNTNSERSLNGNIGNENVVGISVTIQHRNNQVRIARSKSDGHIVVANSTLDRGIGLWTGINCASATENDTIAIVHADIGILNGNIQREGIIIGVCLDLCGRIGQVQKGRDRASGFPEGLIISESWNSN